MRLSELVSPLTPSTLTQVALILFLAIFTGVVIYVFARDNREIFERARRFPLADDTAPVPAGDRDEVRR
jgi:cbb3-type cytochrome oxidase subunit 3